MKNFYIILATSIIAFSNFTFMEDQFSIYLEISREEHSEDANSSTEIYKLENQKLKYQYNYRGYHPDPKFEREQTKETKITSADIAKYRSIIAKEGLSKNYNKKYNPTELGSNFSITLKISDKGKQSILNISGPFKNLDEDKIYRAIENLKYEL
jgi:hypothetical protein